MTPKQLMDLLFVASGAITSEQRARVAWRACDHLWRSLTSAEDIVFARQFNNLCQDEEWPWVDGLWTEEEIARFSEMK